MSTEHYEPQGQQIKRLATQDEDLRRQQGRTVGLAEDLQRQLSEYEQQVDLLPVGVPVDTIKFGESGLCLDSSVCHSLRQCRRRGYP